MLGVDRLDMIKGIPQKILAFEKFLEENADWRDKVVLLQIAVPTRTDVPECMLLYSVSFLCPLQCNGLQNRLLLYSFTYVLQVEDQYFLTKLSSMTYWRYVLMKL